nr:hypothetical protein GCM10020093_101640 [Planobispora longispora]
MVGGLAVLYEDTKRALGWLDGTGIRTGDGGGMRFGVPLGLIHPDAWKDVAVAADELGFESVWLPEHLVFTTDLSLAVYPGTDKPGISPSTPCSTPPPTSAGWPG